MSASEQASEPSSSSSSSSSSSRLQPLPPPLPPPPPRPPVAAEGRGAQAARAAAVWARIREAPRSGGPGGDGPPHLHAISMRPAPGPPSPAPPHAGLICMHIPRRHIPGLNPAAPGACCKNWGAGPSPGRGRGRWRGAGGPGGREEGEGMRCSLPPLDPKYLPAATRLGIFKVSGQKRARERSATFATSFRLLGKPQDFREERGGGSSLREEKVPASSEGTKASPRRSLGYFGTRGRFGVVEKCKKHRKRLEACRWRVRGGVAPGASAGRLALHDLSPEATGLAAESEGGSSGPRAQ